MVKTKTRSPNTAPNTPAPAAPNRIGRIPSAPDFNYADFRNEDDAEKLVHQDFASEFVDVGRRLQQGLVMNGVGAVDVNDMFATGSAVRAGAPEMRLMAEHVRAHRQNSDAWQPYERRFHNHMSLEAELDQAAAHVDFEALRTRPRTNDPNTAESRNVEDVIGRLQARLSTAVPNSRDEEDLTARIMALQTYITHYLDNPEAIRQHEDYLNNPGVPVLHPNRPAHPTTTNLRQNRLGGTGSIENNFVQAHLAAENDNGPRAKGAKGRAKTMDRQLDLFDTISQVRLDAYRVLANEGTFRAAPVQGAVENPMEYVISEAPYDKEESKEDQERRAEMEKLELDWLRSEVAKRETSGMAGWVTRRIKSGIKWNGESKFALARTEMDGLPDDEVRAMYEKARDKNIRQKYGKIFEDPYVDPKIKRFVQTKALTEEWAAKRKEENMVLQHTPVAKIAKWVGKHKMLTLGIGTILIPMTAGASVGFMLAATGGLITGAKIDEKMRGMKDIDTKAAQQDLIRQMRNGKDYAAVVEYMDKLSKKDRRKEKVLRSLAVAAGGGAVGATAFNYIGPQTGATELLHGSHKYLKAIVGAAVLARMLKNKDGGGHH